MEDSFVSWYEGWLGNKSKQLESKLASYKEAVAHKQRLIERTKTDESYTKAYDPFRLTEEIANYEQKIEAVKKDLEMQVPVEGIEEAAKTAYQELAKISSLVTIVVDDGRLFLSTIPIKAHGGILGRYQISISQGNRYQIENLDYTAPHVDGPLYHPHIWKCKSQCLRNYQTIVNDFYDRRQLALMVIAMIHFLGNFSVKDGYTTVSQFIKTREKIT